MCCFFRQRGIADGNAAEGIVSWRDGLERESVNAVQWQDSIYSVRDRGLLNAKKAISVGRKEDG
jgi:hypothetical protein